MRKIFAIILVVALIAAMAIPAFAVTPAWEYKPAKLPQIKIGNGFIQGAVSNWFKTNPIDLPAINITYTSPTLN